MKTKTFGALVLPILLVFFASACDDDKKSTEEKLRKEGWGSFESGDYQDALDKFDAAIAENPTYFKAYEGRGWARLRLENVDGAEQDFQFAQQNTERLDAFAGDAFIKLANSEFETAIEDAEWVLQKKSKYVFKHDEDVDHRDMKLVAAFSFFHLSNYTKCMEYVVQLNPNFDENATTSELLQELERLNVEINGGL